jgi:hypothetical protein
MSTTTAYNIPLHYRKMENLHILFWLLKDISWCMVWKPLGIAMIFPTLIISIVIAWRTRELVSELTHNLAISFWITANAYWMISEFFSFDNLILYGSFTYKQLALVPFLIGLSLLIYYYLWYKPRYRGNIETM